MSPLELGATSPINSKLVIGSASLEKVFRLKPGQHHQRDTTLDIYPVEDTFGGSGLCNAVASTRTGVLEDITFITVGGMDSKGNPDEGIRQITNFTKDCGIVTKPQFLAGPTEQSWIILGDGTNDPKRGFRLNCPNGESLRNQFSPTENILQEASKHPLVVASSFPAEKILELAKCYKRRRDGFFVWTINQDSAEVINKSPLIHEGLSAGFVDIMFMSEREYNAITRNHKALTCLEGVDTLVITKGAKGCYVRSHLNRTPFEYTVPSFHQVDRVINDNGAGETQHNNFLATITSLQKDLAKADRESKLNIVHAAARIGNMAAYIKIQQPKSLWFPQLNFPLIRKQLLNGTTPERVTELAYLEHQERVSL